MKKFFLNRAIKKQIRKSNRNKQFVNFHKAQSVLLLYECGTKNKQVIQEFIFQLSASGKDVFAIGFIKGQNTEEIATNELELVGKKDINFLEQPNKTIRNKIANRRFDLLLDLTSSENLPMLYIALFANAAMKASSHITHNKIFDFILDINKLTENKRAEDIPNFERFLFEKIVFYLKTIQTSD
ncbi:MAG: hypothetical protein LBN23_06815 [Paludibacter sp.]|jgi:hypothetical protein|nr:hypothetical protein [Paludibacter sp.]